MEVHYEQLHGMHRIRVVGKESSAIGALSNLHTTPEVYYAGVLYQRLSDGRVMATQQVGKLCGCGVVVIGNNYCHDCAEKKRRRIEMHEQTESTGMVAASVLLEGLFKGMTDSQKADFLARLTR